MAVLNGRFMGSGSHRRASTTGRCARQTSFGAGGRFDMRGDWFSFYSQLRIKDR